MQFGLADMTAAGHHMHGLTAASAVSAAAADGSKLGQHFDRYGLQW